MAENTPTPDPPPRELPVPPSSPLAGDPAAPPPPAPPRPAAAAKPKRRRHRVIKSLLLLFAGVLILIAILPTLLSMGWARHIVEGKANAQLRGRLEIGDWSLGWFTGARLGAVNLYDTDGQPVFQLTSVDTHLSITDVLRGNFDLGTVPVTGMRLYITREPDGTLNLQKLLPPKPAGPPSPPAPPQPQQPPQPVAPPSPPAAAPPLPKLPNISIDLELTDCQAIYTDATTGQTVTFPISGSIKIPNINQPITHDIQIGIQPGSGSAGTISLTGSISAIHDNQFDSNKPDVDETLKLAGMDLSAFKPMLSPALSALAGHGDGEFSIHLTHNAPGSMLGGLTMAAISASGKATKGDTFNADSFTVTIPPTSLPTAAGLDAITTTTERFTTGMGGAGGAGGSPISIILQQGKSRSSITLDADTAMSALKNLAKKRAPGSDGKLQLLANIDFVALANQLPHLIHLQPGMVLVSGELKAGAGVAMTSAAATPTMSLAIDNVAGTKAGKSVALKPISLSASAHIADGGSFPKFRDLQAQLTSAFAGGSLSAPTPSQMSGQLTADLAAMQKELGQIFDFGPATLSGSIAADIGAQGGDNDGSPTQSTPVHGSLTGTNIRLDRGDSHPINVPKIYYSLAATVVHGPSESLEKITGLDITGTVGPDNSPALTTHFATDLSFGENSSVVATNVNIAIATKVFELRRELGTATASNPPNADYTVTLAAGASGMSRRTGCSIDISKFTVTDNHGLLTIQRAGDKDIRFATGDARQGNAASGLVSVSADLAALNAILSSPDASGAVLTAGHLDGWMALSGDGQTTQFQEDLKASSLAVRAGNRTTPLTPIELQTTAAFGPSDEMRVSSFSATGAGGEIHLKQPLIVRTLEEGQTAINAELVGGGDMGQAMAFLAAFEPSPPPAVWAGTYAVNQSVSTSDGVISAKGSVQSNFTIANNGAAAFTEPNCTVSNDLSYDQVHDVAEITNFAAEMQGSGALRLSAHGKISDLSRRREMKDVSADLHYDSAALWKLIYATLSAKQRKSYADVKLAGVVDRHFTIAGSYPADHPFNVAVKALAVQGGIALPSFEGNGMSIANLDLPFSLQNGLFALSQPKPATMNNGTLNLAGITVDLGDVHERLTIPDNTAVLNNISLNPVFVQNASGWVNNPLFAGADQAKGILNVVIDHCNRLPTDDLVKATSADNDGTFHMHMTLGTVQIGAPMLTTVAKALGPLLGQKQVPSLEGQIPNYTLDIAEGIMTTDMTMTLSAKQHPLKLYGTVALASQKLNMTMEVPTALFGGGGGPLAGVAGESLKIPITGTVDHPKPDVKAILKHPGVDLKHLFG